MPPIPVAVNRQLPDGPAGTRETLKAMRDFALADLVNMSVRATAQRACAGVAGKDWMGEILALFEFVRARIKYSLDPHELELIQYPSVTLRLGYGDCDDMCTLLACLLLSKGHPCSFVAVGFDAIESYSHVIVAASGAGETAPIALDPTEARPAGWSPPGITCMLICPIIAPDSNAWPTTN